MNRMDSKGMSVTSLGSAAVFPSQKSSSDHQIPMPQRVPVGATGADNFSPRDDGCLPICSERLSASAVDRDTVGLNDHQGTPHVGVRCSKYSNSPMTARPCRDAERADESSGTDTAAPADVAGHRQKAILESVVGIKPSSKTASTAVSKGPLAFCLSYLGKGRASASTRDTHQASDHGAKGGNVRTQGTLEEVARMHGVRFVWLSVCMFVIVCAIYITLFVQQSVTTRHLVLSATKGAVKRANTKFLNYADRLHHDSSDLLQSFLRLHANKNVSHRSSPMDGVLCSRLYGAPLAFGMYGKGQGLLFDMHCSTGVPSAVPSAFGYTETSGVQFTRLSDAQFSACASDLLNDAPVVVCVILSSLVLTNVLSGRHFLPSSGSTVQHIVTGVLMHGRTGDEPSVTLVDTTTVQQPKSTISDSIPSYLDAEFQAHCTGNSAFVWHTVTHELRPLNESYIFANGALVSNTTMHSIPAPLNKFDGIWSCRTTTTLCAVYCYHPSALHCDTNNPTNLWFIAVATMSHKSSFAASRILTVAKMMALVVFISLFAVLYLGVAVPIRFMRAQLLGIVDGTGKESVLQKRLLRYTKRWWIGEMTALIRVIHVVGLFFRFNKKYVPAHVLQRHTEELFSHLDDFYGLSEGSGVASWRAVEENESDHEGSGFADLLACVNTMSRSSVKTQQTEGFDTAREESTSFPTCDPDIPRSLKDNAFLLTLCDSASQGCRECERPVPCKQQADKQTTQATEATCDFASTVKHDSTATPECSATYDKPSMVIKRDDEATLLCVRINDVESAYLINYTLAVKQHRRIIRFLLSRIRHGRGAVYYRSGDCLCAAWNAFDSCPNHAEMAAMCAEDIALAFDPYRMDGLQIGIALHQGTFVCGTIEEAREAFATAFGDAPRKVLALAELAAEQRAFSVLATEAVKQSLGDRHETLIVDVIKCNDHGSPLILFELGPRRAKTDCTSRLRAPLQVDFAVEYAKVFYHFRNHGFVEALRGIQFIRERFPGKGEALLSRLESLSHFFQMNASTFPMPYYRPFPLWVNYESAAKRDRLGSSTCGGHGIFSSITSRIHSSKLKTRQDDSGGRMHDEVLSFKRELYDNIVQKRSALVSTSNVGEGSFLQVAVPPHDELANTTLPPAINTPTKRLEGPICSSSTKGCPSQRSPCGTGAFTGNSPSSYIRGQSKVFTVNSLSRAVSETVQYDGMLFPAMRVAKRPLTDEICHDDQPPPLPNFQDPEPCDPCDTRVSSQFCFSIIHNMSASVPVTMCPAIVESVTDARGSHFSYSPGAASFRSIRTGTFAARAGVSTVQSVGLTVMDDDGLSAGMCGGWGTEVEAKNGKIYLRSTRLLGKGSFGSVFLGMDVHSGKLVAIKFLPLPSEDWELAGVEAEVMIMQRVKDPYVVEFISYAFHSDTIVIIMECMMAGSLQNMVTAFKSIPSCTARVFIRDVLRGLHALHSHGVIHRDVKPQNVLLSLSGSCKISDFGASAWLQEMARKGAHDQGLQVLGTPVYLAPEAAKGMPEKGSDIWSCGIIFLQLVTGKLPYSTEELSLSPPLLVFQIGSGSTIPVIPDTLHELDAEFVRACLKLVPSERPPAELLLQMPLFAV